MDASNRVSPNKLRSPSRKLIRTLSDNLRRRRQHHGFSQEELADRCGLHRTYIGSVERGERNVTLGSLEVIANALGVSVPWLLSEHADSETRRLRARQ